MAYGRVVAASAAASSAAALEWLSRPARLDAPRFMQPAQSARRAAVRTAASWWGAGTGQQQSRSDAAAAARGLVGEHLADFRRDGWDESASGALPLSVRASEDSPDHVSIEFALPPAADWVAVFGSALDVSVPSLKASTPFARLLGQVTMRDAVRDAEYSHEGTVHVTSVRSGTGDVVLRRDWASGAASLSMSTRRLHDCQARALANAYAVAHGGGRSPWRVLEGSSSRSRPGVARKAEALGLLSFEHEM